MILGTSEQLQIIDDESERRCEFLAHSCLFRYVFRTVCVASKRRRLTLDVLVNSDRLLGRVKCLNSNRGCSSSSRNLTLEDFCLRSNGTGSSSRGDSSLGDIDSFSWHSVLNVDEQRRWRAGNEED